MIKQSLNGTWKMSSFMHNDCSIEGIIPGSVYSFLLAAGEMEDPYYRDNELRALEIINHDFEFLRTFIVDPSLLSCNHILLRCYGLDTVCDLQINGKQVGTACNMHRCWDFDITEVLHGGKNEVKVLCHSPVAYIKQKDMEYHVGGSKHAMRGFPHLRKAHCMFGWDWGPRLPDAGIWKDIELVGVNSSSIDDVCITQDHEENGKIALTVSVKQTQSAELRIYVETPSDLTYHLENDTRFRVPDPQLWWPNGLGKQPLYTVGIELVEEGKIVDSCRKRIGLCTMTLSRRKDAWGESFSHCCNGMDFFAMGADYIPEDNILSRMSPKRTRKLLEQCKLANFNVVRVWGGGVYPSDDFYDSCDELGLMVWQDMMFACANYPLDYDFEDTITMEIEQNVKRLRHHPSLGVWCGNNEMEQFEVEDGFESSEITRAHYIRMYEHIIPHILKRIDPTTPYWPSSPSSGGSFVNPTDPNRGDVHYWAVWHGGVPFKEYRKYFFRYVSEFGFQSFPCMQTISSFTEPGDLNIFSRIMEMHQRNEGANGKILTYLSKNFLYPTSLEKLVYASQLLQAEAIKYGVEHWRRNRGRCMGAIYWQLNDIWPTASWASIDYFGRWKALHYYAKRFFSPVMISCEEIGEGAYKESVIDEPGGPISAQAKLCVANESLQTVDGVVKWRLCSPGSEIHQQGEISVTIEKLSSFWLDELDFGYMDFLNIHLQYELIVNEKIISSGSVLFTEPKHYHFIDPHLSYTTDGSTVHILTEAYAKSVEVLSNDPDFLVSDNYFDMEKGEVVLEVIRGTVDSIKLQSVFDIR